MKNTSSYKSLNLLWALVLLLLLAPNIQSWTNIVEVTKLFGKTKPLENPPLNSKDWFNGDFQRKGEAYRKSSFGFRNTFVRLYNQTQWTLFKTTKQKNLKVGKEGYLFWTEYMDAYFGQDEIDPRKIEVQAFKINRLQDTLSKLGIDLVVALAPGKASFFPEYFPKEYAHDTIGVTNYELWKKYMKARDVEYIDFMEWFLAMKDTATYPLFPKCGTHWSVFGEYLAADSLVKYIEQKKNAPIPRLVLDTVLLEAKNTWAEYDLGHLMNLMTNLPTYPMGHPQFHIEKNDSTLELKGIAVADSYFGPLLGTDFAGGIFSEFQYWKYFTEIVKPDKAQAGFVKDLDNIKTEIEKQDVIILLAAELNYAAFPFGFINEIYPIYFPEPEFKAQKVAEYIARIKSEAEWLAAIQQKASAENKSLEEMIQIEAEYLFKVKR